MPDEPTRLLTSDDGGLWAVRSDSETIYVVDLDSQLLLRAPGPTSPQGEGDGSWVRLASMEHVAVGLRPRWGLVDGRWWRQSAVTSIGPITRDDVDRLVSEAAAGKGDRTEQRPETRDVLEARRNSLLAWVEEKGGRERVTLLAAAHVESAMLAHGALIRTEALLSDIAGVDRHGEEEAVSAEH